ncbi:6-phosphofructo-2-kinase/fructose-2,6-bisphosphatase [Cryptococcus neoformans var. grubii Br795]|nr:6-phosphofructo-2-kinase/fructose-2,6-bisphosphatase [Cryptococcus neoformans var. grubii Br795]
MMPTMAVSQREKARWKSLATRASMSFILRVYVTKKISSPPISAASSSRLPTTPDGTQKRQSQTTGNVSETRLQCTTPSRPMKGLLSR